MTGLKLIEAGVPKDKLALLALPMVPLQVVLPLIISRYTNGPNPMNVYLKAMPYRWEYNMVRKVENLSQTRGGDDFCGIRLGDTELQAGGSVSLVLLRPHHSAVFSAPGEREILGKNWYKFEFRQVTLYSMFVAVMAFFARVSDPRVGGTYMTLLNTLTNLGGNWPATLMLWLVDGLTWKNCSETCDTPVGLSFFCLVSVTAKTQLDERFHSFRAARVEQSAQISSENRTKIASSPFFSVLCGKFLVDIHFRNAKQCRRSAKQ